MGGREQAEKAAWAPYQEVIQVFPVREGFSGDNADRGKYPTGRKPRYGPGGSSYTTVPVLSGYFAGTSFSPEQKPYTDAVRVMLNNLASGIKFVHNPEGKDTLERVTPLEDRIVAMGIDRMRQQQGVSFDRLVADASLTLIDDFKKAYPNLMPALKYFFDVAGADGIEVAATNVYGALYAAAHAEQALKDRKAETSPEEAVAKFGSEDNSFTRRHSEEHQPMDVKDPKPAAREVTCADRWLGRYVEGCARDAAVRLAKDDFFRGRYILIEDECAKMRGSMWGLPDRPASYSKNELREYVRRYVESCARSVHIYETTIGPLRRKFTGR